MATLTVRIPDDKHGRLKALAQHRHVSVNKLFEELSTQALAEFDSEVRTVSMPASEDSELAMTGTPSLSSRYRKAIHSRRLRNLSKTVSMPVPGTSPSPAARKKGNHTSRLLMMVRAFQKMLKVFLTLSMWLLTYVIQLKSE